MFRLTWKLCYPAPGLTGDVEDGTLSLSCMFCILRYRDLALLPPQINESRGKGPMTLAGGHDTEPKAKSVSIQSMYHCYFVRSMPD